MHNQILFIHGGPGFNSFAEEQLFREFVGPDVKQIHFWNEPSKSRPEGDLFDSDNAFKGWFESARKKVLDLYDSYGLITLVAHSFSVATATKIVEQNPEIITQLILLTPSFNLNHCFRAALSLAIEDFKDNDLDKSERMMDALANSKELFDASMLDGLKDGVTDAQLFNHYWHNKEQMVRYYTAWRDRGTWIDYDSFFSVCKDFVESKDVVTLTTKIYCPTVAIFGKLDPIVSTHHEIDYMQNIFENLDVTIFENSSHYPHLEETSRFFDILHKEERNSSPVAN